MKKITLGLITLLIMFLFVGCSSNNNVNTEEEVIEEIQQTLDQNDVQVITAFGNNSEAKEALIQSSELHSNGLIALCINPEPMILGSGTVQKWFEEAIERTELTAEQQVQIARIGEFAYTRALLLSSKLTAEGLVAICETPKALNLNNNTIREWLRKAIERTELTAEQQVQIAKLGKFAYSRALLLNPNLTAEGLVAVCESPDELNLKNRTVQKWFKEAIERTELTTEQQVQIAKSKIKGMGLF